jgi:hypothetical protein
VTASASAFAPLPYTVLQPERLENINFFTLSQPLCGLEYFLEAQPTFTYDPSLFSLIQLTPDFTQLKINATNNSHVGTFNLQIRVKVKNGGLAHANKTFTLDIYPECSLTNITQTFTSIPPMTYVLPRNYTLDIVKADWTQSPLPNVPAGFGCKAITHELIYWTTNGTLSSNPFGVVSSTVPPKFVFSSSDYLLTGYLFTMNLSAYLNDTTNTTQIVRVNSSSFQIRVEASCLENYILPSIPVNYTNITYTIGSAPVSVQVPTYYDFFNGTQCGVVSGHEYKVVG